MISEVAYKTMVMALAFMLLSGPCSSAHVVAARRPGRVNCTKYVFAPVCRGVAAKRTMIPTRNSEAVASPPQQLDDLVLGSFLSSVRKQNADRDWRSTDNVRLLLRQSLPVHDLRRDRDSAFEQRSEERPLLSKLLAKRSSSRRQTKH